MKYVGTVYGVAIWTDPDVPQGTLYILPNLPPRPDLDALIKEAKGTPEKFVRIDGFGGEQ